MKGCPDERFKDCGKVQKEVNKNRSKDS